MGKKLSIGVSGIAHKGKKAWIGVDGKARKIKKAWIGDTNGKARLFFSGSALWLTRAIGTKYARAIGISEDLLTWEKPYEFEENIMDIITGNGKIYVFVFKATRAWNVYYSSDNGVTWTKFASAADRGMGYYLNNTLIQCGYDGYLRYSTDDSRFTAIDVIAGSTNSVAYGQIEGSTEPLFFVLSANNSGSYPEVQLDVYKSNFGYINKGNVKISTISLIPSCFVCILNNQLYALYESIDAPSQYATAYLYVKKYNYEKNTFTDVTKRAAVGLDNQYVCVIYPDDNKVLFNTASGDLWAFDGTNFEQCGIDFATGKLAYHDGRLVGTKQVYAGNTWAYYLVYSDDLGKTKTIIETDMSGSVAVLAD